MTRFKPQFDVVDAKQLDNNLSNMSAIVGWLINNGCEIAWMDKDGFVVGNVHKPENGTAVRRRDYVVLLNVREVLVLNEKQFWSFFEEFDTSSENE